MNIFSKLTLKTLKENRTRTLVTIAGIIISAAMFTAITTLIVSLQTYMYNSTGATEGFFHGKIMSITQEEVNEYKKNEHLESYFTSRSIGYAELEGIENEAKPYLLLLEPDNNFLKNMPVNVTSGHLPQNDSEILIPDHLNSNGGVKLEIGQQIKLQVGKRVSEGYYFWQDTPYHLYEDGDEAEYIEKNFTKTYTVCGFYERTSQSSWSFEPYSAPGYTAIVKNQNVQNAPIDFYYNMDTGRHAIDFYLQMVDNKMHVYENTDLLLAEGTYINENFNTVLYSLAAILIAIIVFASVALIYNTFAISVSSRTKQFGLLSSIGATKRQMKSMVFREAVFLSIIGIPIGILCGLGGIGITLNLMGDKFSFMGIGNENVKMAIDFSPLSVIIAAVIAFVTVLISAYIPSKRCAKVTAIEAIRQNKDIKTEKHKEIKTSKFFGKLFGFNGMLAQKYMGRDKKKYRTVTASLAMSVILIISSGAFSVNLISSATGMLTDGNADLLYSINSDGNPDTYKDITTGFELAKETAEEAVKLGYAEEYIIRSTLSYYGEPQGGKATNSSDATSVIICFINDEAFDSYARKIGADPADFKDPENPKGILYAKAKKQYDQTTKKYKSYDIFEETPDSFTGTYSVVDDLIDQEERNKPLTCYVGAEADVQTDIYYDIDTTVREIIYPISIYKSFGLEKPFHYGVSTLFISEKPDTLQSYLLSNGRSTGDGMSVTNIYSNTKNSRDMSTVITVFAYGFITLIALIAVANIFNTVSTGIILRRKEFAMLKSVGMTDKGVVKILSLESLMSGIKSLVIGLPVSAVVCVLINLAIKQGVETSFLIPWASVIGAVAGVFAVMFISMLYAAKKLKKENILDSIRDENI